MLVLVLVPGVAFAQVPGVDQVVGGVTDTTGGIVQEPALPALPPSPLPVQPPAVSAPTVQAPAVSAPTVQAPAVQAPASQAPASQAPAPGGGSARADVTSANDVTDAGGGHARAHSRASGARKARHAGRRHAHASAAADAGASEAATARADELAMANKAADPLPEDPRPARSPFTGFALGLLCFTGLSALGIGLAIRRGAIHLHLRRATS